MSSASTIARSRSRSAEPGRGQAFARTFRWGDASGPTGENQVQGLPRSGAGYRICLITGWLVATVWSAASAADVRVTPANMTRLGTIDERFQSYNVEMVEVTGGNFWRPYGPIASDTPADLFAYRAPIDLTNPKLRRLAAALAPAYMRVSGTWANATWFADTDSAP